MIQAFLRYVNRCCLDIFTVEPVQISTPVRPEVRRTLDLAQENVVLSPIVDMQSEYDTEKYATYSISTYCIV